MSAHKYTVNIIGLSIHWSFILQTWLFQLLTPTLFKLIRQSIFMQGRIVVPMSLSIVYMKQYRFMTSVQQNFIFQALFSILLKSYPTHSLYHFSLHYFIFTYSIFQCLYLSTYFKVLTFFKKHECTNDVNYLAKVCVNHT